MKNDKNTFQVGGPKALYVLIISSLCYLVDYMDRNVMGVLLQPIKIEFGLNDFQAGLLPTVLVIGVVLFVFPTAHLVDRWSRKKMISVMVLFWSLFTFLTGIARNFPTLLATRFFVGVGEAGYSPAAAALISASYHDKKKALMLGIYTMFVTVGSIIGVVLGGYVSANFGGWRVPFLYFAIPGVILAILALFMQDYKTVKASPDKEKTLGFWEGIKALMKIRSLRWLWLGYGLYSLLVTSVLAWIPALLMRTFGFGEDKAGVVIGIVALVGLMGAPIGGLIADRWQSKTLKGRIFLAGASVFAAAVILLFVLWSIANDGQSLSIRSYVLLALYGLTNTMAIAPLIAISQDVASPDLKGRAWGMSVLANNLLGGAWGPALAGAMSDGFGGGAHGLSIALAITGVLGMMALIFWWFSSRHCPADIATARSA